MLHTVEHAFTHTVKDSLFVILAMFLTYLAMEYLEHRTGDRVQRLVKRAGRLGPVIGAVAGAVPQCGFSAAASNLYAGRVITIGTLLSIYLSTSDEMLPVMIASKAPIEMILGILLVKLLVGMAAGFVIDQIVGRKSDERHHAECGNGEDEDHQETGHHIHEMCVQEHCDCEKGIFRSALHHTVQVGVFLFLISFALNLVLEILGEDVLSGFLLNRPILGPLVAGIVGFLPNCAASVAITELYLEGLIGAGAMLAGLLAGAGVGLLVLFRVNHRLWENVKIAGILYLISVLTGIAAEFMI